MESLSCSDESLQVIDLFRNRFDIDGIWDETNSMEEMAGVTEDDLPPFYLDFEQQWERIRSEMENEVEDYSKLFSEIVEANKEVAISQMNFHVPDEDILEGLSNEDALVIPPTKPSLKNQNQLNEMPQKRDYDALKGHPIQEGPIQKKLKENTEEPSALVVSVSKSSTKPNDSDRQLAFVYDKKADRNKVISLRKGEELPSNYEMASVQALLPSLTNNMQPLQLATSPPPIVRPVALLPRPTMPSSVTPTTKPVTSMPIKNADGSKSPSNRLNSLSDLMTSEMEKKSKVQFQNNREEIGLSKLAGMMKNNETRQDIISKNPRQNGMDPILSHSIEMTFGESTPDLSVIKVSNSPEQPKSNAKPLVFRLGASTSANVSAVAAASTSHKPSLSVTPLGQVGAGIRKVDAVLACKMCGEIFTRDKDNEFRKHLFFKHQVEIIDDKYLSNCQVNPEEILYCKKCTKGVWTRSKREEHRNRCFPQLPPELVFQPIKKSDDKWPKEVTQSCGVGDCKEVFVMRNELKSHTEKDHPSVVRKMILDPDFRCAQCLKRFDQANALGKHCVTCTELRPSTETVLELASSLLYCDLCKMKHTALSDTTTCYLQRAIFRCVLCLSVFKDKSNFYSHLHMYHGLQMHKQPKLLLDCPMCGFTPDKYTVIFPHIVTEHYSPVLIANNCSRSMPPPNQLPAVAGQGPQRMSQVRQTNESSTPNPQVAQSVTTKAGTAAPKRIPELQPILACPPVTNAPPPGIILNTNRLVPAANSAPGTVGQPRIISTAAGRTTASQVSQPPKILLVRQASGQSTRTVHGMSAMSSQAATVTPAGKQVMSGLLRVGSLPASSTRIPQIGLVRPLPTSANLIIRPVQTTTTPHQRTPATSMTSTNMSTISSAVASTTILSPISISPLVSNTGQAPVVTSIYSTSATVNSIVPPATSVIRAPVNPCGSVTITPAARTPMRPPLATSVLTISAAPAVRAPIPRAANPAFGPSPVTRPNATVANKSSVTSTSGSGSSNPAPTIAVTGKPNVTSKSGSRIVTIGGRTFEYLQIQNKLITKSHTVTQSPSGATVARHVLPAPSNTFRVPLMPSGISVPSPIITTSTVAQQPKPNQVKSHPQNPPTTK